MISTARIGRSISVEARKLVDTRARGILFGVASILPIAISVTILIADSTATAAEALGLAMAPAYVLFPFIMIVSINSEWSQRGAQTTFAAEPNRVLVVTAKILAVLILALAVTIFATIITALIAALTSTPTGAGPRLDGLLGFDGGVITAVVFVSLNTVLAAAISCLVSVPAVAVVIFLAFTAAIDGLTGLLGRSGDFLKYNAAVDSLAYGNVSDTVQVLTALVVWVGIPLALGIWIFARRDYK